MSDGGKGSAPRKNQDHEKYAKNWDQIFGKKKTDCPTTLGTVDVTVGVQTSGVPGNRKPG